MPNIDSASQHLRTYGLLLEDASAEEALRLADRFLLLNDYLLRRALEKNQRLYNYVVKTHMVWHLAYMSRYQNPKWTACFEFEDFYGEDEEVRADGHCWHPADADRLQSHGAISIVLASEVDR